MKDRVGTQLPSPEALAEAAGQIDGARAALEPSCTLLDADERASALRPRVGGDLIAETVCRLAEKYQIRLPEATPEAIRRDLKLAADLAPLQAKLSSFAQMVDDTVLEARSEAWWGATALYTTLARLASGNPELAAELKPVVAFFATGRRK
jgi:hypothetical protein